MNCILLPLMKNNKEKQEVIKYSIELAKEIKDEKKQYFTIAGLLTATNNIINEDYALEIRRWLKMTMVEKIYEKEKVDALNKQSMLLTKEKADALRQQNISLAKEMLEDGEDIVKIMRYTKLTAEEIEKLK
jgi:hypothetical protein